MQVTKHRTETWTSQMALREEKVVRFATLFLSEREIPRGTTVPLGVYCRRHLKGNDSVQLTSAAKSRAREIERPDPTDERPDSQITNKQSVRELCTLGPAPPKIGISRDGLRL